MLLPHCTSGRFEVSAICSFFACTRSTPPVGICWATKPLEGVGSFPLLELFTLLYPRRCASLVIPAGSDINLLEDFLSDPLQDFVPCCPLEALCRMLVPRGTSGRFEDSALCRFLCIVPPGGYTLIPFF